MNMNRSPWTAHFFVIVLLMLLGILFLQMLLAPSKARGQGFDMPVPHDMDNMSHWYPSECCSMTDCFPLADGDVLETPEGYRIQSTGEVFPYSMTYGMSQDKRFHRCSSAGNKSSPTLLRSNKACLFPPGAGV